MSFGPVVEAGAFGACLRPPKKMVAGWRVERHSHGL